MVADLKKIYTAVMLGEAEEVMHDVPQTAKTVHAGDPVMNGFALLVETPPQSPQDTLYPGNNGFTIGCAIL